MGFVSSTLATETQKGVVGDADVQRRVVREIVDAALGWGGETVGS